MTGLGWLTVGGLVAAMLAAMLGVTWANYEPACMALMMHPRGDEVVYLRDDRWLNGRGEVVEVDRLARFTAHSNCD